MIIEKLIAKNFKKHKNINLEFTSGKNLITGPNYSGKSTILQALLVGLYGNSMAPGETKDLVHDDASDFEVMLFLDNGVCIKRSGKNSSVIDQSGQVVVRTHTAVNKWCEEMLETDRKTFLKVFASEQGSPQALLAMEGSQLRKFIEQAIGLELLDKLVKKSNAEINKSAAGYNANEELLLDPKVAKEHADKIIEYKAMAAESEACVQSSQEMIDYLAAQAKDVGQEYDRQREAQVAMQRYCDNKETLSSMLLKLPDQVDLININPMRTKLDSDTQIYWDLHNKDKAYKAACKNLAEADQLLEDKRREVDLTLPEEATDCAEAAVFNAASDKVIVLLEEARVMEHTLDSSACPTCNRPFDNTTNLEELAERLAAHREVVNAAVAERDKALEKYKDAQEKVGEYAQAMKRVERAKGVIESLQDQVTLAKDKEQQARIDTLPESFTNGEMKKSLQEQSDLIEATNKSNSASEKVEEQRSVLDKQLAGLIKPKSEVLDLEGLSKKLQEINANLVTVRDNHANSQVCLAQSRIQGNNLQDVLAGNEKVQLKMSEFKAYYDNYLAISEALQGARVKAIDSAFEQTMGIATEFVKTCTGGDISQVYLADSGIRYEENGRSRGTVSASGAQKTLIGLGMKLGLSQIVRSPFGGLLLDEISADMDADVSTACLTVLGEYCQQAIIVSHTTSDVADNIIEL